MDLFGEEDKRVTRRGIAAGISHPFVSNHPRLSKNRMEFSLHSSHIQKNESLRQTVVPLLVFSLLFVLRRYFRIRDQRFWMFCPYFLQDSYMYMYDAIHNDLNLHRVFFFHKFFFPFSFFGLNIFLVPSTYF